jgi:hypothetical protein
MIPIWQGPPAGDAACLAGILGAGAAFLAEDLAAEFWLAPAFGVDPVCAQTKPLMQDSRNAAMNARANTSGSGLQGSDSQKN